MGWLQPLGYSQPSLNLFCSFAITRVYTLLSIWMTSLSWFTLNGQVSGLTYFCVPYWFAFDYILIFLSVTFASLRLFCFLGLSWDTVHMPVSLPPDKLADIQQLALSLLQTQPVTVFWLMSFLGTANFCANGHSKLQRLCCVIQSDMFTVYHSPTYLFSPVHFSLSALCQLEWLCHWQQSPVPLQYPLPDVIITTDTMHTHWGFNF